MKILIPFTDRSIGGPSTFFRKFTKALESRGISVTQNAEKGTQLALVMPLAPVHHIQRWKKQGIKIIQRLDGVYYFRVKGILYPFFNFRMKQIHQHLADFIIYQSQYSQETCEKFLGSTKKPSKIIYNGVDLQHFSPQGERISLTSEAQNKVLFTAAQFRRSEMLLPLLRATTRLRQDRNDFKVIVAGSIIPKMNRLLEPYRKEKWIEFIGPLDQGLLPIYERSSDVFLFSDTSACPNSILEALACGLPIVAFDRGGVGELINEGCGALVRHPKEEYWRLGAFDEKDFCRALENVLSRLELKKKAARIQVESRFNLESMVEEYVKVFKSIS